jgi:hypothetical protein
MTSEVFVLSITELGGNVMFRRLQPIAEIPEGQNELQYAW